MNSYFFNIPHSKNKQNKTKTESHDKHNLKKLAHITEPRNVELNAGISNKTE